MSLPPGAALAVVAASAFVCALAIRALRPWLLRYALARPNARSAHVTPTPQGGGIAVVGATIVAVAGGGAVFGLPAGAWAQLGALGLATVGMALVGLVDDIHPMPALPRLGLQLAAMALAVAALPEGARVLPFLPLGLERVLLVVGGAWFVNLTNFMDGMDGMTVVEVVPITVALASVWCGGHVSDVGGLLALALCGGLLGFAPSNAPVARLFLGDVGSLPIGLVMAFCLFDLASHGGLAAAILLPLYYIADSGITLGWRLRRGDRVWDAHRHHFYQVATARGASVRRVLACVLVANVTLAVLARASLGGTSVAEAGALIAGGLVVALLLHGLKTGFGRAHARDGGRS